MKWSGKIGFAQTVETAPSVYTEKITERSYFGEVLEFARRMEDGGQVNGDITLGNQLSILGDPFAQTNLYGAALEGDRGESAASENDPDLRRDMEWKHACGLMRFCGNC